MSRLARNTWSDTIVQRSDGDVLLKRRRARFVVEYHAHCCNAEDAALIHKALVTFAGWLSDTGTGRRKRKAGGAR